MTHKLIKTGNYLLIVDDSEIKEDDFCLADIVASDFYGVVKYNGAFAKHYYKKIIAHLPLNDSSIIDGVDLLPPLEQEDDVEKLAKEYSMATPDNDPIRILSFIKGYNKAKEKYRFTEEDMRGFHKFFMEIGTNSIYDALTLYIQSLSQPKMPIGLESEINNPSFALTIEPKKTINSQGQTQWVGKYIY